MSNKKYSQLSVRRIMFLKGAIISVFLLCSTTIFAQECNHFKVLASDKLKNAQRFFTHIKTQAVTDTALKQALASIDFFANDKIMNPPGSFYFYQVDINNDQQKEYVFTYVGEGSMGIIDIVAFAKKNGKFVYLGAPPKPATAGDGPWYFNWYRNPKTKQPEFLVKGCGNVYMQFAVAPNNTLSRYLWKNNQTRQIV